MEETMRAIREELSSRGGGVFMVVEPRPGSGMKFLYANCMFTGDGVTPDLVGSIIDDMRSTIVRNLRENHND